MYTYLERITLLENPTPQQLKVRQYIQEIKKLHVQRKHSRKSYLQLFLIVQASKGDQHDQELMYDLGDLYYARNDWRNMIGAGGALKVLPPPEKSITSFPSPPLPPTHWQEVAEEATDRRLHLGDTAA